MSAETAPTTFGDYVPPIPSLERQFSQAQLVRYAGQLIELLGGDEFLDGKSDAFKHTYLHREPGYPDHLHIVFEASRQRYDTMLSSDPNERTIMPDVWKAPVVYAIAATVSGEQEMLDCPTALVARVKADLEKLGMEFEPHRISAQRTMVIDTTFDDVGSFDVVPRESYEVLETDYMIADDGSVFTTADMYEDDDDDDEDEDEQPETTDFPEFAGIDFGELAIDMEEVMLADARLQAKSFLDLMAEGRKETYSDGRTNPLF